jgi:hypothetical protein
MHIGPLGHGVSFAAIGAARAVAAGFANPILVGGVGGYLVGHFFLYQYVQDMTDVVMAETALQTAAGASLGYLLLPMVIGTGMTFNVILGGVLGYYASRRNSWMSGVMGSLSPAQHLPMTGGGGGSY